MPAYSCFLFSINSTLPIRVHAVPIVMRCTNPIEGPATLELSAETTKLTTVKALDDVSSFPKAIYVEKVMNKMIPTAVKLEALKKDRYVEFLASFFNSVFR